MNLLNSDPNPKRGELWTIAKHSEATKGTKKEGFGLVVVVSSVGVGRLRARLVARVTPWKDDYRERYWCVEVKSDQHNKLQGLSCVDTFQLHCVGLDRFKQRQGYFSADTMDDIASAVGIVVEVPGP